MITGDVPEALLSRFSFTAFSPWSGTEFLSSLTGGKGSKPDGQLPEHFGKVESSQPPLSPDYPSTPS